jgi:hypothetical protein
LAKRDQIGSAFNCVSKHAGNVQEKKNCVQQKISG